MTDLLEPERAGSLAPPADASPLPAGPQRWSGLRAFWYAWLRPATKARHLCHIGLREAFAVHLGSAVVLVAGALGLISFAADESFIDICADLGRTATQYPAEFAFVLGIVTAVIEGGTLALWLLMAPWAARDERIRSSLYESLRRVWLQSMHVAVASLGLIAAVICYETLIREPFYRDGGYSGDWLNWPWYMRHGDESLGYLGVILYGWALWGVLRAAGARPVVAPAGGAPLCQCCGYNLSATAAESVCPECGDPVAASIGPDARPGVAWERPRSGPEPRSWWQTAWRAIRRPVEFGRDLQVYSPPADHRRFLLRSMLLGGLVGAVGPAVWIAGWLCTQYYSRLDSIFEDLVWLTMPVSGIVTGLSVLAITLFFAFLVGTVFSLGNGRNLLPAAMRCAAYLSGFVVLWAAANLLLALCAGLDQPNGLLLGQAAGALRMSTDLLAFWLATGFNLIFLVVYLRRLQHMLRAARFAQR